MSAFFECCQKDAHTSIIPVFPEGIYRAFLAHYGAPAALFAGSPKIGRSLRISTIEVGGTERSSEPLVRSALQHFPELSEISCMRRLSMPP